jgi:hypothetical protein
VLWQLWEIESADFVATRDLTIIFPVVLFRCGTWSLTLSEDYRLRLFGNRLLGRMFRPKRDEVTGEWRRLRNEELYDLYCCMICTAV